MRGQIARSEVASLKSAHQSSSSTDKSSTLGGMAKSIALLLAIATGKCVGRFGATSERFWRFAVTVEQVEQQPSGSNWKSSKKLHEGRLRWKRLRTVENPTQEARQNRRRHRNSRRADRGHDRAAARRGCQRGRARVIPQLGLTEEELKAAILKANEVFSVRPTPRKPSARLVRSSRSCRRWNSVTKPYRPVARSKLTSESFKRMHTQ